MNTLFLLVLLTQNGAGDINAAFVNTQTLEQCEQKALMIEGVFQAASIPVIEKRCINSPLLFTEFDHVVSSGMIRNFYTVTFSEQSVQVEAIPDWHTCMKKQNTKDIDGKIYCSSSAQSLQ